MRVPAFLGAALAAMILAAPAEAQSPPAGEAAAPADKPSVVVINPDSAAAPAAAATEAPTSAPSTAQQPAAPAPAPEPNSANASPPATEPANAAAPGAPANAEPPKVEAAAPPPPPPEPTLFINIDLSAQRMTVKQAGGQSYNWPISSAAYGYKTPTGTFQPSWMSKLHYSRQYDLAPMPNAIFFSQGTAIHGTNAVRQLGRPASHGCVRLAPGNAAKLFNLVNQHGKAQTKIVVRGKPRFGEWEMAQGERMRYAEQRRRYAYDYDDYSGSYYAPRGYYSKSRRYPPMPYYNRNRYGYGF